LDPALRNLVEAMASEALEYVLESRSYREDEVQALSARCAEVDTALATAIRRIYETM
jgi:hypothetical protein